MTEADSKQENRILPLGKLSIDKQILILKSYAAFYEKEHRAASYKDIAPIAQTDETNVSACKGFWESIGLLRAENGKSRPSPEAVNFSSKLTWNQMDEAWRAFRKIIRDVWFVRQLSMSMRVKSEQTEVEIINQLGAASGVTKREKKVDDSLRKLFELLVISSVLVKKNEDIFALNPELASERPPLTVKTDEDFVSVILDDGRYAVDSSLLKSFVREHGKKMSEADYMLS